jgi:hypothetical protein
MVLFITLIFTGLQLFDVIDVSWWWIVLPIFIDDYIYSKKLERKKEQVTQEK